MFPDNLIKPPKVQLAFTLGKTPKIFFNRLALTSVFAKKNSVSDARAVFRLRRYIHSVIVSFSYGNKKLLFFISPQTKNCFIYIYF